MLSQYLTRASIKGFVRYLFQSRNIVLVYYATLDIRVTYPFNPRQLIFIIYDFEILKWHDVRTIRF